MTSGSVTATDQILRPGRSVRTVSQARGIAISTQRAVTEKTNATVRASISSTRIRKRTSQASPPAPTVRSAR